MKKNKTKIRLQFFTFYKNRTMCMKKVFKILVYFFLAKTYRSRTPVLQQVFLLHNCIPEVRGTIVFENFPNSW